MRIKKIKKNVIFLILSFILNCMFQTGCSKPQFPNGSIKIFFCGQYLSDSNSETLDIIKEFEKKCKIKVEAYSTFESNEQLYAKLKNKKIAYDVILPSDYMISRMIKEGMLQKINKNLIRNYNQINPLYKGKIRGFDPTEEYSVPYTWGTIGILYNPKEVERLTNQKAESVVNNFNCLFNEKLKKEILMFSNSKDSFALALKSLGYSINTTNKEEILKAAQLLKQQKKIVQCYCVDEIIDKMINNEAVISPAFSGDALTIIKENENLKFCLPESGAIMYVDAMCIPKNAENVENAHKFIDFLCTTKIALENCDFSSFSTTMDNAYDALDEELKNNEIAYPPKEKLKLCETQRFLDENTEATIAQLWEEVKL